MGVHGLWRLIDPSGKPVPLETLENKVLAIDISIWLHQAVKGFQDSKGAPVPNAHLLGIYHRVCKLLYFQIKPIFVFDGGVPALKKQTIAKRTQSKLRNAAQADKIKKQLLNTLLKHTAVSKVLTEKIESSLGTATKVSSKQKKDYLYMLPPSGEMDSTLSSSEDELQSETTTTDSSPTKNWDLHTIDMDSIDFKSLPVDVRHEILTDLKETRKQSSWGRLHELPKVSDDFSVYQLNRLRKRQAVQTALEDAEKEMGGKSLSLAELESILEDQGVITNQNIGTRIASDENKKYLLVKDVKKAMEEARKNESEANNKIVESTEDHPLVIEKDENSHTKADIEYEEDLKRAIALSLECEPSTSKIPPANNDGPLTSYQSISKIKTKPADFSSLDNFTDADFATSSSDEEPLAVKVRRSKKNSAESYMLEYSGLTPNEITKIINEKKSVLSSLKDKSKKSILPLISEYKHELAKSKHEVDVKQMDDIGTIEEHNKELKDNGGNSIEMKSPDLNDFESEKKNDTKKVIDIIINPNQQPQEDDLFVGIFQDPLSAIEKLSNKSKDGDNTVEIMSDDSIESESDEKFDNKNRLDIVINPNQQPEEDDLFRDVFQDKYKPKLSPSVENNEEMSRGKGAEQNINSNQVTKLNANKQAITNILEIDRPNEQFNKIDDSVRNIFVKGSTAEDVVVSDIAIINNEDVESQGNMDSNKSSNIDSKDQHDMQISREPDDLRDNGKDKIVHSTEKVTPSRKNDNASDQAFGIKGYKKTSRESMTEQELLKLKTELQKETVDLRNEKSAKERMAGNITDQMYQEAQELLELFGVPYIIAPMEAEAQCAFLDEIELTDGTITDDSDIWLFGGKTAYKNFFNQNKYVMEFKAESIKHHFKLTREQMVLLALLVGSDYTSGLQGIGPVTAVEILAAFPPSKGKLNEFSLSHADLLSGLKEFRSWFSKGKSAGPGRNALKSKLKNLTFTDNFPSSQVVEAYLEPKVETSREAFSWGKPNTLALIEFAREKFGWTRNKSEEILNPVLKRLEERRHQKSIKDYFRTHFKVHSGKVESKMSKRVKSAITNMGRDPSEIIAEELEEELKKEPKKKRASRKKAGEEAPEFSNKKGKSKIPEASNVVNINQKNKDGESDSDFFESSKDKNNRKTGKANLGKLKPKFKNKDNELPCTSEIIEKINSVTEENNREGEEVDISEKINHIRRRRQLKEAKAAVDIKKTKVQKEKPQKVEKQLQETIPEGLQADEEVNLLSQIAIESSIRVNEIHNTLQDQINNLTRMSVQIPKQNATQPIASVSQSNQRIRRPVSRPTRVPRKEVIPQKEKDKTAFLRNKLKAIEVFRKGKLGPGYVPKKERKKKLPKAEAELSESSDE